MQSEDSKRAAEGEYRDEADDRDPWDDLEDREGRQEDERRTDQDFIQPDRLLEADACGNRALPASRIRLVLRHLVHQEKRGDEQAEGDRCEQRFPAQGAGLNRVRPEDHDRSEDDRDRDLADAVVLEGQGGEGVEYADPEGHGGEDEADHGRNGEEADPYAPMRLQ